MKKFLYGFGLLVFFAGGAGSVLIVDLVRQQLGTEQPATALSNTPAENDTPNIEPLIPEDLQGQDANNYWNQNADPPSAEESPGSSPIYSFAAAVELAAPAVVNVYSSRVLKQQENDQSPFFDHPFFDDFFSQPPVPREREQRSLGSGVILENDGYIITNYHVVKGATEILIALNDGREAEAEVVGVDPETDIALLKADLYDLPVIEFGEVEELRIGDPVLAIGNPHGVGQTVTQGIISAIGRSDVGVTTLENFLQTDAAINPGNSGGALINARGELVGINTAIYSRTGASAGIGFAIPADIVGNVVDQLRTDGEVERGWMGVSMRSENKNGATRIIINGVFRGSPADELDMRTGDEIISLDGKPFESASQIVNYVAGKKPGDEIQVGIRREENIIDFLLVLGSRPTSPPNN